MDVTVDVTVDLMKQAAACGDGDGLTACAGDAGSGLVRRRRWVPAIWLAVCCVVLWSCTSDRGADSTTVGAGATDQLESLPDAVPGPSGSVPGDQSAAELSRLLKGAPVEAATLQLEAAGWKVRSYDVDDPEATVTADFVPGRVTIGYRQGIVLGIEIG